MQLLPHERMSIVESYWKSLSDEQRVELLSVDLSDLRVRAARLADKARKRAGQDACKHQSSKYSISRGYLFLKPLCMC